MQRGPARSHHRGMTAAFAVVDPPTRRPIPSRPPMLAGDVLCWAVFAAAAVLFVLDAMITIQVLALQPLALEQNLIARWTLEAHPFAPFLLKAAIIAECAVVIRIVRSMDEGWAAFVVSGLMAGTGLLGIATAVTAAGAVPV